MCSKEFMFIKRSTNTYNDIEFLKTGLNKGTQLCNTEFCYFVHFFVGMKYVIDLTDITIIKNFQNCLFLLEKPINYYQYFKML